MNRSDDFTRTNNPTALGTPSDAGTPWVAQLGVWGINSNRGLCTTAPGNSVATLDAADADVQVDAVIDTVGSTPGITFRLADNANYWAFILSGPTLALYKVVASTPILLDSSAGTLAPGDTLTAILSGTSIICQVNGTTKATATDSFAQTATLHGLFSYNDTTSDYSAFTITSGTPPPPSLSHGLYNQQLVFWEYTPATGTALSKLKIWMDPRNVILSDTAADNAYAYLATNTPAGLQF